MTRLYNVTIYDRKVGSKMTLKDLTKEEVRVVQDRHSNGEIYHLSYTRQDTEDEIREYEEHQRKQLEWMDKQIQKEIRLSQ